MKYPVFGERFCTFCGGSVIYVVDNGQPIGVCDCGRIDYCDNETVEDVKKRFGDKMKPSKYDYIYD
jgi:hypothetical protein